MGASAADGNDVEPLSTPFGPVRRPDAVREGAARATRSLAQATLATTYTRPMKRVASKVRRGMDRIPGVVFVVLVMVVGLAPWRPEPYLATYGREVMAWLADGGPAPGWGASMRALGHALPWALLAWKLALDTFLRPPR